MAPEQRGNDQRVDSRADIYSLGVVLYELLTGELPADKLQPPSRKVQIDVRLDEIVMRALEAKPELRFATATDFRTQVEAVVNDQVPPWRGQHSNTSAPRLLKTGTSTITTPEILATFTGQFFHYRNNRGQLLLDEQQLTFARHGTTTVIPLADIRDVSIGRYPLTMNPVGIDLLSVTYDKEGKATQILLSPMEGLWALPSQWNENVTDWFQTLRAAVIAGTGQEPGKTPADKLGLPAGSKLIYLLYCLPVVIGIISVNILVRYSLDSLGLNGSDLRALGWIFALIVVACFAPLIFALKHRLRSASSANHDSPRPANGLPSGIVILITFVMYQIFDTGRFTVRPAPPLAAPVPTEIAPTAPPAINPRISAPTTVETDPSLMPNESPNSDSVAALQLEFAQKQLLRVKRKFTVGAATPKDVLDAESYVTIAEAELRGDKLTSAKSRLDRAVRNREVLQKMHSVGKTTDEELDRGKLAEAIARAEVADLESKVPAKSPVE